MSVQHNGHEHEFEPEYGLPEPLPAGEKILWQGAPDFSTLAIRAFHLRKVALYFSVMLAMRAGYVASGGQGLVDTLYAMMWPVGLALIALTALTSLAWMTATTTAYTLTDRRVVMRIGIVLTLTYNLPLRAIESAGLRLGSNGAGDIPLCLSGMDSIAWIHLWPHARPWRISKPEPMLRCIPDVQAVAAQLSTAWSATTGTPAVAAMASPEVAEKTVHWKTSPT